MDRIRMGIVGFGDMGFKHAQAILKEVPEARLCAVATRNARNIGRLRALPGEDVSDIARSFGGGGHALASGCTIAGPYADSSRAMMNAMEKKLLK